MLMYFSSRQFREFSCESVVEIMIKKVLSQLSMFFFFFHLPYETPRKDLKNLFLSQ